MGEVTAELDGGQAVAATIAANSVERLGVEGKDKFLTEVVHGASDGVSRRSPWWTGSGSVVPPVRRRDATLRQPEEVRPRRVIGALERGVGPMWIAETRLFAG